MNTRRLKRLAEVRRRLRDRESATAMSAQRALSSGQAARDAAEQAELRFTDEARARLSGMRSASAALLVSRERALHAACVTEATDALDALEARSEEANARLRSRAKDLRVTELVLERARLAHAQRELTEEQRLVDDLVSARVGGDE